MSCRVPREGALHRLPVFSLILLILAAVGLLSAQNATAFDVHCLGDVDNVTVMEVSGNYDAVDSDGRPDMTARQAIAREFYRNHGDDYDFLVIFTNFDFRMPSLQARAFFSPAKNDVRGIGLELNDHTWAYSHDGSSLARLQGTIDMASIAGHVLEPADPQFETTLLTLSHEVLHRWGAYVRFLDAGAPSDALLGFGGAHWSFLLDAGGSTLYGNNWQDNGDGTFTSLPPEQARDGEVLGRIFSPLDLYLMGLIDKGRVPPLLLIDSPGLDRNALPAIGVTIPGTAKTVTIDDIIAVEGARVPAAADSRKEFRMAFIYAVTPGSWRADDPRDRGDLAAINRLQAEWAKRFSILTGSLAMMRTSLAVTAAAEANPDTAAPETVPAAAPSVDAGIAWLISRQHADGFWRDLGGTEPRDTAAAVAALKLFPSGMDSAARGEDWLKAVIPANCDFLARKLLGIDAADPAEMAAMQNADGGWGSAPGFRSNPVDTALALQAQTVRGNVDGAVCTAAINFMHAGQHPDGGWGNGPGDSRVQPTAEVLLALNPHRRSYPLEPSMADGLAWLLARQNADGGFGNNPSTVSDTAVALRAIKATGASGTAADRAAAYLLSRQADDGSWNGSAFQTAQAIAALHAGQVAVDLAIEPEDIAIVPATLAVVPASVTLTATVRNLGRTPVAQVRVALYRDDPAKGDLLGEQRVDLAGNASTPVAFSVPVAETGLHRYCVTVDGDSRVAEANEWNNSAFGALAASIPPPTTGFVLAGSSGSEAQSGVALSVSLSYPWPEPIIISYAVGAGGSAIPASDFLLEAGSLVFEAGQTGGTISLTVVDDLTAESDKTVIVDLANPTQGTLGISRHVYTIHDDEAPLLSIESPLPGPTGQNAPLLVYATTGGNIVVKLDGSVVDKVSGETLGPLVDGVHFIEVAASNRFGLTTVSRVDFAVDTALPTVSIRSPLPGAVTDARPLLDYTVTSAVRSEVLVDGVAVSRVAGDRLGPLADGTHTLTVSAWNAGGLQSSRQVEFRVDARPPTVDILYPVNGFIRESNPVPRFRVDEPGETVIWLDGVETGVSAGQPVGPLNSGVHRLRVTATDAVGNAGSDEVVFAVTTQGEEAYLFADGWPELVEGTYGGIAADRAGNLCVVTRRAAKEFDIARFDAADRPLWRVIRSSYFNIIGGLWVDIEPKDVAIDSAGNIYIAGFGYSLPRNYSVLAKYDANGNYVKHVLFDTGMLYGDIEIHSIHIDNNDRIYVSGNTDNDLFSVNYQNPATMFVAKYDQNLNRLYGKCFGNPFDPESFYFVSRDSMTVDQDQNVLVTGRNGNQQLLVWKLVEDLSRVEAKNVGPVYSAGMDIDTDLSGNLYVAGRGPSGGTLWKYAATDVQLLAMQGPFASAGLSSLVANPDGTVIVVDEAGTVRKLDRDLTELWSTALGADLDSKLIVSATGQLFVGGSENSPNAASIAVLSDPRIPPFNFSKPVFHANSSLVALGGYLAPGYSLTLEGRTRTLTDFDHDADTGRWEMLVDGFPEGESRIAVSVTSLAGFVKQYETRVLVDTVAPRVNIVEPADGSVWSSRPWLSYAVSDGESRVYVNGVDVTKKSGFQLDSLRPGENRIRVQSTDLAGNAGYDEVTIQAVGAAVGETPLVIGTTWNLPAAGDQTVVDVGEDAQGNIYLLGDTARGLPGYASSSRDLYVAKYDRSGKLLNLWQIGRPTHDYGVALAVTSAGEFIVAYNTRLDPANPSIAAMVVSRYGANGSLLWSDELSSGAADQLHDLAIDATGNIYLCGDTTGRLNNKKYGGNQDYFLVKYSPQGGRIWTVLSSAPSFDSLRDIEFSHDGYLYGMGRMTDVPAMTLFKFDLNGTLLWKNDYMYPKSLMLGKQMKIGRDGSFYTFNELQTSDISYTYYVTRHDPLGNFVSGVYGQAPAIRGLGLSLDAGSNVYVTGYSDDPYGWGWSLDGNQSFGDEDIFVAKYAADDLRALWTRQIGDARGQQGNRLLFSRVNGQAYLAGVADGEFAGAEGTGLDAFLASLGFLPEFPEPALAVMEYRSPTRQQAQVVRGYATPGATLAAAVAAPFGSPAKVSPPAHHPDGAWSFLVSNLPADTDSVLTISATGASGSVRQAITLTVDTTPPMLSIDPVASPTALASQTITGHCETDVTLTVAGRSAVIPIVNGRWRHEIEHLRGGDNLFTFTATDAAGNQTVRSVTMTYVPPPPPTLAVSPAVISTDEPADVILKIGNLSPPGATAIVTQVLDLDGNGRADTGEPVVRQFSVTDGVTHDNLNIVSDTDGFADGQITARLNYRFVNDRYHAAGQYVVTAETLQGQAVEAFAVIMVPQSQRLEGRVRSGEGAPVCGALVELFDPWGRSHGFAATDAAGHYRFNIRQPGDYLPVPLAEGYVFDRGAAPFATVVSGEAATQDLAMLAGARRVSGRVCDEGCTVGLAGVLVRADSSRYLAATMTAADGSYHLRLPDGEYALRVETRPGDGLASRGYVGSRTPSQTVRVDGDLAGQDLLVSRGTDLLCGKVRSSVGADIGGAPVLVVAVDGAGPLAETQSNLQGAYCVALATGGIWQPGLHDLRAYGVDMVGAPVAPGSTDLIVYPVDARIAGTVRDAAGQPVAGVTVTASHVDGVVTAVDTARDGRYLLGVSTGPAGDWVVTVSGEISGYAAVLPLPVSVTRETTVMQDFTLAPLMANTISVIKASYDARKKVLAVEATSNYDNARLQVDGYGPMTFTRVFKGKYYWTFSKNLSVKPALVTVSGAEGAVTATVQ